MLKFVVESRKQRDEVSVNSDTVTIGRGLSCDVVLNDTSASREHARIMFAGGYYVIQDLGSRNGTCVNGKKVAKAKLKDGDLIQIGATKILVKIMHGIYEDTVAQIDSRFGFSNKQKQPKAANNPAESLLLYYALQQMAKHTLTAKNINNLMKISARLITQMVKVDRLVFLLKDSRGELQFFTGFDRNLNPLQRDAVQLPSRIVARSFLERRSIACRLMPEDTDVYSDTVSALKLMSVLCVPIWDENACYGLIYGDTQRGDVFFRAYDVNLLTGIGYQIALRMEHDRLIEQMKVQEKLRARFERFLSPDVVEAIVRQGESIFKTQIAEVSVLFVDLAQSSRLARQMEPEKFLELLNKFYSICAEKIFKNGGNVNKYMGDAVFGVFNAPLPLKEHEKKVVNAAIEIRDAIGKSDWGLKEPLSLHIGVNTGKAVVGIVGPLIRSEFTVLGDPVNRAAKVSKYAPLNTIVVGSETVARVTEWKFEKLRIEDENAGQFYRLIE